jgi:hypothetical protein
MAKVRLNIGAPSRRIAVQCRRAESAERQRLARHRYNSVAQPHVEALRPDRQHVRGLPTSATRAGKLPGCSIARNKLRPGSICRRPRIECA